VELQDALSIAALGIGVVFGGLSLTALLIVSINRMPRLVGRLVRRSGAPETQLSPAVLEPPLDPEIVTVIATVLEVEHRLHHSENGKRLTLSRRT